MFLTYRPAEGDEQKWTFKPGKLSSKEAEAIEKRTGWTFEEFGQQLLKGSTLARRALLWTFQRRTHHTIKFEDIDFLMDEVKLEMDKGELLALREQMELYDFDDEATRKLALAQVDQQIAEAEENPEGPKEAA